MRKAVYWMVAADTGVLFVFMWLVVKHAVPERGSILFLFPALLVSNIVFLAIVNRRMPKGGDRQ